MNYRVFSVSAFAVFTIIAALALDLAISADTAGKNIKVVSSNNTFVGILLVKEGHGDILVRSGDGHQRRLVVKQSSNITRNGKAADFNDLKVRDQVRVSYDADRIVIELVAIGS